MLTHHRSLLNYEPTKKEKQNKRNPTKPQISLVSSQHLSSRQKKLSSNLRGTESLICCQRMPYNLLLRGLPPTYPDFTNSLFENALVFAGKERCFQNTMMGRSQEKQI